MLHYVVPYAFIPSSFPPLSLSHLFSWLHLLLRSFLSSFGGDLQWRDWPNSTLGLCKPFDRGILHVLERVLFFSRTTPGRKNQVSLQVPALLGREVFVWLKQTSGIHTYLQVMGTTAQWLVLKGEKEKTPKALPP